MTVLPVSFAGGALGPWRVTAAFDVVGEGLPRVERLAVREGPAPDMAGAVWTLRGVAGHARYATRRRSACSRCARRGSAGPPRPGPR